MTNKSRWPSPCRNWHAATRPWQVPLDLLVQLYVSEHGTIREIWACRIKYGNCPLSGPKVWPDVGLARKGVNSH
ncbi:MAG: hypothetical protein H0Z39_11545 [Peptococcaceae bacterium]|nr:hypothetical protein [Peptococcaceae bacterium]